MSKPRLPKPRKVTDEEIQKLSTEFFGVIDLFTTPGRQDALREMYADISSSLLYSPASAKVQYHNAFPGGYIDHVLRVIKTAHLVKRLYVHIDGVPDCTDEEITFAAMHHDLGKLGDEDGMVYEEELDDFWMKKGSYYNYNDQRQRLSTFDRGVYMLQKYGVKFTKNEMVGMRMADGLFEPATKTYFEAPNPFPHRSNIGYIIHWADWMSCISEKDQMRKLYEDINA
jgi:hypothetical protein